MWIYLETVEALIAAALQNPVMYLPDDSEPLIARIGAEVAHATNL